MPCGLVWPTEPRRTRLLFKPPGGGAEEAFTVAAMSISRVKRPRSGRVPHHRVGAWTLLELAVALVVLGLLVGIAIPMYSKWQERARISQAISDIVGIENS